MPVSIKATGSKNAGHSNGKSIYFDSTRAGRPEIWKRNLATGEAHSIAPAGSLASLESLDGTRLFFAESDSHDIWMANTDGSNAVRLEHIRPSPDLDWALGLKEIYFTDRHDSFADLFVYNFEDKRVRTIGRLPQTLSLGTPSLAVSPDGKWILYAVIDHTKSDIRLRRDTSYNLTSELARR